tara:strand:+ start:24031 stop:26598 length:2568 start_codon:yes stop_codon:yes gene_type:complete
MLNLNSILTFVCVTFFSVVSVAQPLTNGMGIITHWTGFSGEWDAFSIYETEDNASATLGQNWATNFNTPADPTVHDSWKGTNMGDVFGIAIDADKNVYFSATKAISSSGSTGTSAGVAGDGGVYKMDANTWIVTPFIFTGNGANEIPNQGNGLGNIAYDKWNNQLFVTNFEDGNIYRFDMSGNLLSTFDPFTANTTALGTFSGHGEALWGINVYGDSDGVKVYFSLWTEDNSLSDPSGDNNSVWSIDLDATGDFAGSETLCFALEDNTGSYMSGIVGASYPISDITFSSDGKMYVCEKVQGGWGAFGGWNDFFTPGAHSSRLFEYQKIGGVWTRTIKYAVGNYNTPNDADNTTGGVALGNRQLPNGEIECEKIIWASGDALRFAGYNDIAGQDYVYGLTGIPVEGNSNDPTDPDYVQLSSIYIDVDYTGTGSNGGQKMSYGDIEIYSDAVNDANFTISPNTIICPGESIQLNVSGGGNYEWSPSATLDDNTSDSPTASPTENTIYTVTGEGSCGGRDTVSVSISIDDFTFSLGPDLAICDGISGVSLDAGSSAIAYIWNTGQTSQTISVNDEGIYSVSVTSPAGCNYTDEVSVENKFLPTVLFGTPNDNACPPAKFTLLDESIPQVDDPIVAWNWQINNQNYNNPSPNVDLPISGSYNVTLEVTTELGCVATLSLDDYLSVHNLPSPNFITEPEEISQCDKTIKLINFSTGYDSLSWDFGDGFVSAEDTNSEYTYNEVGSYLIKLNTINEFGCEDQFYREINPIASIPFFTPNAFTPDGDELNETFTPQLGCTDQFEFWVMNRWGEVIFYSNDVNVGWDGTYEKQICPVGVYSWKARYNGAKNNQIKLGEVHLMN